MQESSLIFSSETSNCEVYKVKEGSQTSVFKLINHQNFKHTYQCKQLKNEYKILSSLKHPNIIKLQKNEFFQDINEEKQGICALSLEYCEKDMLNHIQSSFPNIVSLKSIKQLFYQISQALDYLHNDAKQCHFDIKLQNIFMKDKSAVLGDFGLSASIKEMNKVSEKVEKTWAKRNKTYLPLEAVQLCNAVDNKNQKLMKCLASDIDWTKIDVFQFGISLFSAIFLLSPFKSGECNKDDEHYQFIVKEDYKSFWESNPQFEYIFLHHLEEGVSQKEIDQLKDLLQQLLSHSQIKRPKISQAMKHEWFRN